MGRLQSSEWVVAINLVKPSRHVFREDARSSCLGTSRNEDGAGRAKHRREIEILYLK